MRRLTEIPQEFLSRRLRQLTWSARRRKHIPINRCGKRASSGMGSQSAYPRCLVGHGIGLQYQGRREVLGCAAALVVGWLDGSASAAAPPLGLPKPRTRIASRRWRRIPTVHGHHHDLQLIRKALSDDLNEHRLDFNTAASNFMRSEIRRRGHPDAIRLWPPTNSFHAPLRLCCSITFACAAASEFCSVASLRAWASSWSCSICFCSAARCIASRPIPPWLAALALAPALRPAPPTRASGASASAPRFFTP